MTFVSCSSDNNNTSFPGGVDCILFGLGTAVAAKAQVDDIGFCSRKCAAIIRQARCKSEALNGVKNGSTAHT